MQIQAIAKAEECQLQPPRHVAFPYMERLVLGALIGAVGGVVAGGIAFPMEAAGICAALLAPFFALAGALCGVVSRLHGWARVRPIAWAMVGGILLFFEWPFGWVFGGMLGGMINGLLRRSVARTVKGALVGVILGMAGWALTGAYLIGLWLVWDCLGGK